MQIQAQIPASIPGSKLIHLQQRTPEWHAWRNGDDLPDKTARITGTVSAIIAGDSVTGKTAHQLWLEWTGRKAAEEPSDFLKKLFEHGSKKEVFARQAYSRYTGNEVFDICVEHPDHPWAAASLDGLTFTGDIIGEFKCPISQRIHTMAKKGIVPSYYVPQVMWQLLCTPSAEEAHYWSHFEEDEEGITGALVVVRRDERMIKQLFDDCLNFRICVAENRPPASNAWLLAARKYVQMTGEVEEANARLDDSKKALLELIPQDRDSFDGGGVMATRFYTKQVINWDEGLAAEGKKPEEITEALESTRELGAIDYPALLQELGLPQDKLIELEMKHRAKGPVDYKKAAEKLGLTKTEIKVIEQVYKTGGEERHRITVTSGYVPVVTPPATNVAEQSAPSNLISVDESNDDPVLAGTESWSGW